MINLLLDKYLVQPWKEFFNHFACCSTNCCDEHKWQHGADDNG